MYWIIWLICIVLFVLALFATAAGILISVTIQAIVPQLYPQLASAMQAIINLFGLSVKVDAGLVFLMGVISWSILLWLRITWPLAHSFFMQYKENNAKLASVPFAPSNAQGASMQSAFLKLSKS